MSEAQKMVDICLDNDVTFFDTANVYNQGLSEEFLGKALGANRRRIILASKVRGHMRSPREYEGLSQQAVRKAIEDSLHRLGTDYLDIYYLHQPDYDTPLEETLQTMDELRREGKVRYIATSNYSAWQICEMHWICDSNGWQRPWLSQPMYNLVARGIEQEYLSFTRRMGVSNVCYNPLAGGLLTGKQTKETGPLANTRFDKNDMYLRRYWHDEYFTAVGKLKQLAEGAGLTLLQLSIAWLMQQEGADCVILGASRSGQLIENLKAAEAAPLDPTILQECDRVWQHLRGPVPIYNR